MAFDRSVLFQPDAGRCRADDTVRALQDRAAEHGAQSGSPRSGRLVERDDHVVARCREIDLEVDAATARDHRGSMGRVRRRVARGSPADHGNAGAGRALRASGRAGVAELHPPRGRRGLRPQDARRRHQDRWAPHRPRSSRRHAHVRSGPRTGRCRGPYAERWLPGVEPIPVFGVTCLYTTTPTEDFVVDRRGPFVVGSPCSGHGFKFTPVIGLMLADLAMGTTTVPRMERFRLPR